MEIIIILTGVIIANLALGTLKSVDHDFDLTKMWKGALDAVKSIIAVLALYVGYIYLADIDFVGMVYSPIAYFFIGLTGVYYLNSCLRNISIIIFKSADIQILKDLDEWFKKKLGNRLDEIVEDVGPVTYEELDGGVG